jgi:hypothetical protein
MVYILNLHQIIMASGVILVYDLKGFSLGHLTKLNLTAMRQVLFHIQVSLRTLLHLLLSS